MEIQHPETVLPNLKGHNVIWHAHIFDHSVIPNEKNGKDNKSILKCQCISINLSDMGS